MAYPLAGKAADVQLTYRRTMSRPYRRPRAVHVEEISPRTIRAAFSNSGVHLHRQEPVREVLDGDLRVSSRCSRAASEERSTDV
jgi:hypothetical protein